MPFLSSRTIKPLWLAAAAFAAALCVCPAIAWGQAEPGPQPAAEAAPPATDAVGHSVQPPVLLRQTPPKYPPLARKAKVQGIVVLHATIGTDGRVDNLSVISGHPLLCKAAMDAVRQWQYQPTLLDGKPIEVELTVSVGFALDGSTTQPQTSPSQESSAPQSGPATPSQAGSPTASPVQSQPQNQAPVQSAPPSQNQVTDLSALPCPAELKGLASELRLALQEEKVRKVLLRDFHVPGEGTSYSQFENWMGSCVATEVTAGSNGIKVLREQDVKLVKSSDGFKPDTSHVNGMVLGELDLEPRAVRLTLTTFHWSNWNADAPKTSETLAKTIPLTDAMLFWIPNEWKAAVTPGSGEPGVSFAPGPGPTDATPPASQVAHAPSCISCPPPTYPAEARQLKVKGFVVLKAEVGLDGRAHDITIIEGPGHGFDEAAVEAVGQWRFKPAVNKDGSPTVYILTIQIQFQLLP